MRSKWIPLMAIAIGGWVLVTAALTAQVRSNNPSVSMMDNCSEDDPAYDDFGGCPEGAPFPGSKSYTGDVTGAEFFELLFSPLAGTVPIGHPSWRNEPSYLSIREGQTLRVDNQGGRAHTFTEVADFGGGFVPLLNGSMATAPECENPAQLTFVPYGGTQNVTALEPGLHKFQCCIHPWMRGAVRIN